MTIKPLHDQVLILPEAVEEVTEGGIIVPDTAKEKPFKGTVIAVGPGKKDAPMEAKLGDKVLFTKFSGKEIPFEGVTYLIMSEAEILFTYE